MARAYKVESENGLRFAGSVAHARQLRDEMMEIHGLRKKDVRIDEEVEIPSGKGGLLEFLNEVLAEFDADADEGEEEKTEDDEDEGE